ncbi:MAG: glycine zipper 2TM domain-containing protein [Sphingomonadales bacterium]|nr:glycine zipper 2TM domain-containing protein [Sphingomonadales bacterium]
MRSLIFPIMAAGALALGGCASNYAGEGALAGGVLGAGVGALAGDVGAGAAIGAAAGGVAGATIHKDRRGCYYYDRDGRRHSTGC